MKVMSVNKGSAYDKWAHDLESEPGWKVESFGTNTDAIPSVLAGRALASVAGNTVEAWAVKGFVTALTAAAIRIASAGLTRLHPPPPARPQTPPVARACTCERSSGDGRH
jgi:hypothetical protein